MNLLITPEASRDLDSIFDFIAQDNVASAWKVAEAAQHTFELLVEHPALGRIRNFENHVGIRSIPIRGFEKYLVFYRIEEKAVRIIRILHGARDLSQEFPPPKP